MSGTPMRITLLLCFISISLLLAGCANTPLDYRAGTEVSRTQLAQFIPGKTRQTDVTRAIGHPNRKEALGAKEIWYYDFNKIGAVFNGNISESTVFEWNASGNLLQAYKTGQSGKTGNALLDAANGQR